MIQTPTQSIQSTPSTTEHQDQIQNQDTMKEQNQLEPKLSKNAQKRLKKQLEWEAKAPERKEFKRLKKIKSKQLKQEQKQEQEVKQETKKEKIIPLPSNINVWIDTEFNQYMQPKELKSAVSQVARCYSVNRSSPFYVDLTCLPVQGELKACFNRHFPTYSNWKQFIQLNESMTVQEYIKDKNKKEIIYLTGDSPNDLVDLNPNHTYIIGGIVDHNRHKNLCLEKAQALGLQTAKLPISSFMHLKSRKILTINHVFEILLHFVNCRDWKESFLKVIPSRKLDVSDGTPDSDLSPNS